VKQICSIVENLLRQRLPCINASVKGGATPPGRFGFIIIMNASIPAAARRLLSPSVVCSRIHHQHQPTILISPVHRCCCRRFLGSKKTKRKKSHKRQPYYEWEVLGKVPPPPPLSPRERQSVFESLDRLEFLCLLIPPLISCGVLIYTTAVDIDLDDKMPAPQDESHVKT